MKTDTQVRLDVIAALKCGDASINFNAIDVRIRNGMITLAGYAGSFAERCEIEQAARRALGSDKLVINIDVVPKPANKRNGPERNGPDRMIDLDETYADDYDWAPDACYDTVDLIPERRYYG